MFISPENENLQYCGRIDFEDPKAPVFVYAASQVRMTFTGKTLRVVLKNHRSCWTNEMGYLIDGRQGRILLRDDEERETYLLADNLSAGEHELLFFKRMDSCHIVTFIGFLIDDPARVLPPAPAPARRIEVFGDSVSCGEVSEATDYVGREDPVHDGQYSNCWYSYAWMTARKLGASLHNTSQGGIALLDGTGWFAAPDCLGMESCYDKIGYNPQLGPVRPWDFSRYTPHVVIVAIGQNDSHPADYMAEDYDGDRAVYWRKRYKEFVERLMGHYPDACFVLATTILSHHKNWDRAIGEVCAAIGSSRVHHFLYKRNGCGTPGHVRIPEAEEMAEELTGYLLSLGEEIWKP